MFKVIGNFSCNNVDGKIGQLLSLSDLSPAQDHIESLINNKLIEELPKGKNTEFNEEIKEEIKEVKSESPEKTKKKNKGV